MCKLWCVLSFFIKKVIDECTRIFQRICKDICCIVDGLIQWSLLYSSSLKASLNFFKSVTLHNKPNKNIWSKYRRREVHTSLSNPLMWSAFYLLPCVSSTLSIYSKHLNPRKRIPRLIVRSLFHCWYYIIKLILIYQNKKSLLRNESLNPLIATSLKLTGYMYIKWRLQRSNVISNNWGKIGLFGEKKRF